MDGAGGTKGGIGEFLIGFFMMCGGFYLLLNSIVVSSSFGLGVQLYGFSFWGGLHSITTGFVLIPFMFGVALIFYNGKSIPGWLLAVGSVAALIFGVITSLNFSFRSMSAFDLLTILVLAMGGLGLFVKSLAGK
jgi:energy-coupling factor transporter transmembrane protein EcfT